MEEVVKAIHSMTRVVKDALESLGARILERIEPLKELPNLTRTQSEFIEEGFADQIAFQAGVHLALRDAEIAKHTAVLASEIGRADERGTELQRQVETVRQSLGSTCEKIDKDLENRVRSLDSAALQFLDSVSSQTLSAGVGSLEIPYHEQLDADDQVVMATRLERLGRRIELAVSHYEAIQSAREAFESTVAAVAVDGVMGGTADDCMGLECYVIEFTDSSGTGHRLVLPPCDVEEVPVDWREDFHHLLESGPALEDVVSQALDRRERDALPGLE